MSIAYDIVRTFEKKVCEFTGAPFGVAVESCSAAIFLCLKYLKCDAKTTIKLPKRTYPSTANSIIHCGGNIEFCDDNSWQDLGFYRMTPLPLWDSAKRFCRGMYKTKEFYCLSFHGKKTLPIGRGGMILCPDEKSYSWFKIARFDGRHECSLPFDNLAFPGWNMYMTPEQAARGIELMQWIKDENIDSPDEYQDLSQCSFYGGNHVP